MKRGRSFEIALSAMACAVASVALTLGAYVKVMFAAGLLVAVYALMVPLAKDFPWGAALASIGAFLLAFLFSGGNFPSLLPFLTFFGLHPVVNWLQKKYVKGKPLFLVCETAKAVWFDLAMWLNWQFVFVPVFLLNETTWYPFVEKYFFLVLFLGGTVFFWIYDFLIVQCQRSANAIIRRIGR